jgi:putative flippase GtrA
MVRRWSRMFHKYREPLCYLIVGGCTTVINYCLYFALNYVGLHYMLSNTLAWCGAVAFAYFANGRWVYRSVARRGTKEAGAFVLSRLFSLGLESALLLGLVDFLHLDENLAKILVAVVVVVVNYLTGRLVYKGGTH